MVIQAEGVVKSYGQSVAVDHIDLNINQGDIHGVLGPEGSGKSTLIACLLSLIEYDSGEVKIFDQYMGLNQPDLKRRIGLVTKQEVIFQELRVVDNLSYFAALYEDRKKERQRIVSEVLEFTGLVEFSRFYPKDLSSGIRRVLNFACGIVHKPELLILDEPLFHADAESRQQILQCIIALNKHGTTILLCSGSMEEMEQICSRITMLDKGKVLAEGSRQELKGMINVREKINLGLVSPTPKVINQIQNLPFVHSVSLHKDGLEIRSKKGSQNLIELLEYLREEKIEFRNISSDEPTLNDVYFEMTGKDLREKER